VQKQAALIQGYAQVFGKNNVQKEMMDELGVKAKF
jgi:hypothetical protein